MLWHCNLTDPLMQIHNSQSGAEQAAKESRSVNALEDKYAVQLDFGGISSEQVTLLCPASWAQSTARLHAVIGFMPSSHGC